MYGDMSVRENLRYFARILGAPPSRVDEAIDEVDLGEQADQLTRTHALGRERSRVSSRRRCSASPSCSCSTSRPSASTRCSGATSGRCSTDSPRRGKDAAWLNT